MRKLLMAVVALMLMLGGSASMVAAQDAATPEAGGADEPAAVGDTSFSRGLDAPATYLTDRGGAVATLTVVDVERGWAGYGEYYAPDPGVEYVAVTFEVSVVSSGNLVVKPFDFSLVDGGGRNNSRSYVSVDDASSDVLFEDDAAVASGETAEMTLVFELYEDVPLGFFVWQPTGGILILVDLTEI